MRLDGHITIREKSVLSCRKHSFIYQSLSITTVADPLSADLITMSLRLLSDQSIKLKII